MCHFLHNPKTHWRAAKKRVTAMGYGIIYSCFYDVQQGTVKQLRWNRQNLQDLAEFLCHYLLNQTEF